MRRGTFVSDALKAVLTSDGLIVFFLSVWISREGDSTHTHNNICSFQHKCFAVFGAKNNPFKLSNIFERDSVKIWTFVNQGGGGYFLSEHTGPF